MPCDPSPPIGYRTPGPYFCVNKHCFTSFDGPLSSYLHQTSPFDTARGSRGPTAAAPCHCIGTCGRIGREISRRLQDRVLFGAGYPLFTYERLVADWKGLGYSEAILRKLFLENVVAVFPELRSAITANSVSAKLLK